MPPAGAGRVRGTPSCVQMRCMGYSYVCLSRPCDCCCSSFSCFCYTHGAHLYTICLVAVRVAPFVFVVRNIHHSKYVCKTCIFVLVPLCVGYFCTDVTRGGCDLLLPHRVDRAVEVVMTYLSCVRRRTREPSQANTTSHQCFNESKISYLFHRYPQARSRDGRSAYFGSSSAEQKRPSSHCKNHRHR